MADESLDAQRVLNASGFADVLDREITVREYLKELLRTLWTDVDGFSGKRPFGNSGWYSDLVPALGSAGLLEVKYDSDGYVEDYDDDAYDRLIRLAIEAL